MKTIKFRAWNNEIMHTVAELMWAEGGLKFYGPGTGEGIIKANPKYDWKENTILMQFTGLQDKNGKDIYEGDIVKIYGSIAEDDPVYGNYEPEHEVYFDDELCEFGLRQSNELFHRQFSNEFEVIGNIHEHSHLLNS